jgi:hypothetical protein
MRAIFLRCVSGFVPVVFATLAVALSFIFPTAVFALQPPATVPPADVQKVLSDIGDLDLLKALVPLRLTAVQIEKLQVPLKAIAADNAARRKTDYDALKGISADLAKAREASLNGEPVSQDVENKILLTLNAADDRFAKAKQAAIDRVFAVVKDTFSSDQKDEMERQVGKMLGGKRLIPKEYANDPKKAPKDAVQDLAVQLFVERILIADRISDLLTQLKPTPGDDAKVESDKPKP